MRGRRDSTDGNMMVLQKIMAGTANAHIISRGILKHAKVGRKFVRDKDTPKLIPRSMKPLHHKVYDPKEARYCEVRSPTDPKIMVMVQEDWRPVVGVG